MTRISMYIILLLMILVIASSCRKEQAPSSNLKPSKTFIMIEAVDGDGHVVTTSPVTSL